jgi:hypothetical protein
MNERLNASPPQPESYSPLRRTALVLTGTGTAGAYHAGVLRALHEAGVKLDVVAGCGIGVVGAMFAAIDGSPRLWEERGFWTSPRVAALYGWGAVPRIAASAAVLSLLVVALPLVAIALGLIVFPIDFVWALLGGATADGGGLSGSYLRLAQEALAPQALPTWLPRLVVLILGGAGLGALLTTAGHLVHGGRRRVRGPFWWRLLASPVSAASAVDHLWEVMWDLVRGAARVRQPSARELARRYTELLIENFGQPGFRELLITVHDLDARRDLVLAMVAEGRRLDLIRRATTAAAEVRRAEVFDLASAGRDYLADAVAGALSLPVATEPHSARFAADAYWRGETHRLCCRTGGLARLLDEVADLDVEQVVLVSATSETPGPHALAAPRLDARGRLGEYLQSAEAASVRDATCRPRQDAPKVFTIRPAHNPLGPFDFQGGFDDRSDRLQPLAELMSRAYEDAYRQFIEPIVGASGERLELPAATHPSLRAL